MGFILNITEETFGNTDNQQLSVLIEAERMSLADLIRTKTAAQVKLAQQRNAKSAPPRSPFINLKEQLLTGANTKARKQRAFVSEISSGVPDPEKAGAFALDAFRKNIFFVLVDGQQREDLDEELLLTDKTEIHFIRLMPLIGG